jgi:hypothetical protein
MIVHSNLYSPKSTSNHGMLPKKKREREKKGRFKDKQSIGLGN